MYASRLSSSRRISVRLGAVIIVASLPVVAVPLTASAAPAAHAAGTSSGSSSSPPTVPSSTENTSLRSAYSSTYVLTNGQHKTTFHSTPVNFRDATGSWQKVDNTLVPSLIGGWHNSANSLQVHLPASLSSPVSLASGGSSIGFTLHGASGTGSVSGKTATYSSVLPSTSASYAVTGSGVKENLYLSSSSAPSTFTWSLELSSGLTAQLTGSDLTIANASGAVATIAAPTITDAGGVSGVASWSLAPDGSTLTLIFDPAWLAAPGRAFPVVVDPTASYLTVAAGCTIKAANPTSSYCNTTDLGVGASAGSAQRGMVYSPDFTNGTASSTRHCTAAAAYRLAGLS
jgi:P pilus assembly chaperone PapD